MADADRMTVEEVVRKVLLDEHADVLREAVKAVCAQLMELEVVRHEALSDRAGCETSPPGRRIDSKAPATVRTIRYSVPASLAGLRIRARIGAREVSFGTTVSWLPATSARRRA